MTHNLENKGVAIFPECKILSGKDLLTKSREHGSYVGTDCPLWTERAWWRRASNASHRIRLSKIDDDYLIDNTYPNRLSDMTLVVNRKIDVLLAGT